MNNNKELEQSGYFLIKNNINNIVVKNVSDSITTTTVNYGYVNDFINNHMVKIINKTLDWNVKYTKYRVSNNNNSTDASSFHRDIIYYENVLPIMTCLTYLTETLMEIIPKSHNKIAIDYLEIPELKPLRITMYPGDILVFYSSLIHRGIFSVNQTNRKLIQVFEVYKNPNDFTKYNTKILHLPSIKSDNIYLWQQFMINISKIEFIINIVSYINLLNVASGYGYHINNIDNYKLKIFSSEGLQDRIPYTNSDGPINKYIMMHQTIDATNDECNNLRHILIIRQIYIYIIIILLFIVLLIIFINRELKKYNV